MLIIEGLAFEVLEQVKGDLRLMFFASVCDDGEIAAKSDRTHVVTHRLQGGNNVEFRSPPLFLFLDAFRNGLRRHELLSQEHEDSKFCFR